MSRKMIFGVVCALAILPMVTLRAQESSHFYIGILGGANFVSYTSDVFPASDYHPTENHAHNGNDLAAFWGLSSEFRISNNERNFLAVQLYFDSKSSRFNTISYNDSVYTALRASLSYITVNVAYKYNFFDGATEWGPAIQIGGALGVKYAANFDQTEIRRKPEPPTVFEGIYAVVDASGVRLTLRPELTYDIPLNPFVVTPRIGYDFPITQVDAARNWRASAIFTGVSLHYKVNE